MRENHLFNKNEMENRINEYSSKVRDLTNANYKLIDDHNKSKSELNDNSKKMEIELKSTIGELKCQLSEESSLSQHLKLNNEKLQENLSTERKEWANKITTLTHEYEQYKRETIDNTHSKDKQINEIGYKQEYLTKENNILLERYNESKRRYENLSKEFESTKDDLLVRNDDIRVKLRDAEERLAGIKEEFNNYKNATDCNIQRKEQDITNSQVEFESLRSSTRHQYEELQYKHDELKNNYNTTKNE